MSRRPSPRSTRPVRIAAAFLLPAFLLTAGARAQPEPPESAPDTSPESRADAIADDSPDGLLESYLRTRGLDELLAEHLRGRLERTSGEQRVGVAQRLGAVYARMLSKADTESARQDLVRVSGDLLEQVPAADTFDLRIALTKARYLTAEQTAERARLELADAESVRESIDAFRSISAGLVLMGQRADRRVDALERRERAGGVNDLYQLRADLAEARRQRSLAKYYAGWSLYYEGFLTKTPGRAGDALKEFGYLLGAEGADPALDKLPRSLLRYEHVARAAMGVALCHSLRGDDVSAVMWLGELEKDDEVNPAVVAQLFARKVTILTAAKRWDTLTRAVEKERGAGLDEKAATPLKVNEARLLAVSVLAAMRAPDADERRREAAEPLVRAALGDLLAEGASAQVLDLVERYGTLPLGDEGFIGRYVRGLRAYRAAREQHEKSDQDPALPTRDPTLVAAYVDAADLLTHAFESQDAASFDAERAAAGMMLGMALYYKDNPATAAARFEQVAGMSEPGTRHAEALWMAIVAYDRAIEQGRNELESKLHSAAVVYVRTYPEDERSARLLLRFADSGLFDRETSLAVLLGVPRGSTLYLPARAHAADVLYRVYSGAPEPMRSELAGRFIPVAFDLIEPVLDRARDASPNPDAKGVEAAVLRIRQVLDAALTPLVTDQASARRAFGVLHEMRTRIGDDVGSGLEGELAYRRLQLAIADADDDAQLSAHGELEAVGGPFLAAADRFIFSRALERWRRTGKDDDAERVVEIGTRLIGDDAIDRELLSSADATARAATALWDSRHDKGMLAIAIDLDKRMRDQHVPTAALLRRLATNAEASGDLQFAFEVWTQLSSSIPEGGADWFEARYGAISALSQLRPAEAREAMSQHKVLYPQLGPKPWDKKYAELDRKLEQSAGGHGP
ncbi:MAG: hypothetical protein H6810_10025 [Phycisphaeraceae bacterium]|nr:MAG: hypothetical protein H6810_10025 [Phycisphaeraceae bacterium]